MQHEKTLQAAVILLSATTFNAQATLTTTTNGLGVYDSGLNATWTQDANLLGTLEGAYQSNSYNNIVTAIIDANGGVIHDTPNHFDGSYGNYDGDNGRAYSGTYTLSAADFTNGGYVNWFAAQAFVHYLDTINYGGSNQWALPTQPDQNVGYNVSNSQLGELYYNELNALAYPGTNGSDFGILHNGTFNTSGTAGPFANAQPRAYWSGTEYAYLPSNTFNLFAATGYQGTDYKSDHVSFAWAVSPGQVSAVPVPSTVWLFGTCLLGLLGLKRRGHTV